MAPASEEVAAGEPRAVAIRAAGAVEEPSWLLLIHQIPPKPDYLRVRIGRRLQRIGAVALKNSVYVLPWRDDTYEDAQWVVRDIAESGGEATLCRARFVDGLSVGGVRRLFDAARDADYREVVAEATGILRGLARSGPASSEARTRAEQELARVRRRLEAVTAIDFFGTATGERAAAAVAAVDRRLSPRSGPQGRRAPAGRLDPMRGRTWVTRRDIRVDRIASAWLIRRFIDPEARFAFVEPTGYRPAAGELRFDMFEAEFTHEGDACTFETLLRRFELEDAALRDVAEIVHDVDCKDAKFGRPEAAGLARWVAGVASAHRSDEARLARGEAVFDDLYASFGGGDPSSGYRLDAVRSSSPKRRRTSSRAATGIPEDTKSRRGR